MKRPYDMRFTVAPGRTLLDASGTPALTIGRALHERSGSCPVRPSDADTLTHLFAAAPDLLAACKAAQRYIVADVQVEESEGRSGSACSLADTLRAAIARATDSER